ncbi:hypothetical protein EYF80_055669 [Liparis tanakae]|uniref:Uncharacterized protein n=1 Tax=Liparis tanakae TaxID=230148 RepID=A0A4Z2EZ52_9TELE|nr:hypothetical protein EYF80_055669 [Liparis tanakae]
MSAEEPFTLSVVLLEASEPRSLGASEPPCWCSCHRTPWGADFTPGAAGNLFDTSEKHRDENG